ncbi:MAG TPA: biotin/lipoyl-containing protein [Polyangiaceae bacterium]
MKKLRITVEGRAFDVTVEVLEDDGIGAQFSAPAAGPTAAGWAAPAPAPMVAAGLAAPPPVPSVALSGKDILSQISGVVVSVDVSVGAQVTAGQQLITIEAMKMNTYVTAPFAGKVVEILAGKGKSVLTGDVLVRLA